MIVEVWDTQTAPTTVLPPLGLRTPMIAKPQLNISKRKGKKNRKSETKENRNRENTVEAKTCRAALLYNRLLTGSMDCC